MKSRILALSLPLLSAALAAAQPTMNDNARPTSETYLKLAAEVDAALNHDVLDQWFPRSIDHDHGGFHSHYARDWQSLPSDGKFSVFQGRMTWVASQVVLREPGKKAEFLPYVLQGLDFLENTMWDKQDGGFFWGLDDNGQIAPVFGDGKQLYGIDFCIYGASAAYQASGDKRALELAKKGFYWLDQHAHDSVNGGYFESLTREGRPVQPKVPPGKIEEGPIGPVGYKSMNAHIHLLEALTELYRVWPDATLRARLEETLSVVRDKICVEPGVMNLYFTHDWRAIPGLDSYGHDVETAYLMLETDELLHSRAAEKTERMAKMLVDHALAYGWDSINGGFFENGPTFGPPADSRKEWWVQFEGLNALLLMHQRYGKQNPIYFERFIAQWAFIKNHTIDSQNHGTINMTTADGKALTEDKGSDWKAAYHDGRACWNVSARLRQLAQNP